jgi:hypothetical protein
MTTMRSKFRLVNWRAVYAERCTYGSEGGVVKPALETKQGVWLLPYDPTPSQEDIQVTRRLTESGKMIGIELLDHLIIGDRKFVSLKEKGYL